MSAVPDDVNVSESDYYGRPEDAHDWYGGLRPGDLDAVPAVNGSQVDIAAMYQPVDWREAWKGQPEDIDWLHDPWLERGTVNALFSPPGVGKSLLTLEVCLGLVRAASTVVYVDDENRIADLVERLQDFGATPDELDRLVMYSFAGLPPLDTDRGGLHLLALAEAAGADLIVLDTTSRMVAGKENDADTFIQLYRCSLVPLKGQGRTVLRLDHPGKDVEKGQRGSSAKAGDVDTIWKLTREGPLNYRLDRLKSRSGHGPEVINLGRRYAPLRHVWTCPDDAAQNKIIGQLSDLGVPEDAGRGRCRAALKEAGIKVGNTQLEAAIRQRKTAPGSSRAVGQVSTALPDCPPVPLIGTGRRAGASPEAGLCKVCGEEMFMVEDDQETHPMCDPRVGS